MGYLISINNQQSGPYSLGQLKSLIQNGQVTLNYWICEEGSNNWIKIDTMPELKAVFDGSEQPPIVVNVQPDTATVPPPIYNNRKLRHGFTSFYLWLYFLLNCAGIIVCILVFGLGAIESFSEELNLNAAYGSWSFWILVAYLIVNAYFSFKILKWEKSGFNGLITVNVIISLVDVLNIGVPKGILFNGISILLIFGVLHIHNAYNAKTAWEQLW
jgi:hypothetical protein